jgi:hypothetical protein
MRGGVGVTTTTRPVLVFRGSGNTYMKCIEGSLFGSNDPWPLRVKAGTFCLLHHYDYDTLFGLWRATGDGGKRLVAKAWGGKFPFQALVALATPTIAELPKGTVGSAEHMLEGARAEQILQAVRTLATVAEN